VAEARRSAVQLGSILGFSEESAGNLAIVTTELATNLANHARGGDLVFRPLEEHSEAPGIEVLAIDAGPGMTNVSQCMRDGFSTTGTPGNGLGAVRRLSRVFDVYSRPSHGTVIVAHVWPGGAAAEARQSSHNRRGGRASWEPSISRYGVRPSAAIAGRMCRSRIRQV
jgi:anti-sigma regulatory factor (Ser/Thr protein kinase)